MDVSVRGSFRRPDELHDRYLLSLTSLSISFDDENLKCVFFREKKRLYKEKLMKEEGGEKDG